MTILEIHKMANTYLENNLSEQKDSLKNRINEDNASEFQNNFTVKTDNDKIIRYIITKNDNNIFISSDKGKPLYIIDDKEATKIQIEKLSPNSIESMSVLKGKTATKIYGDKGENGVIIITTKKL